MSIISFVNIDNRVFMYLKVGGATSIGEQPIKGLVDPKCGARMTVGEALTNLVFAQITELKVIQTSDVQDI